MSAQTTGNLSNWYTQSYGTPFARTSRLRAPSLLPPARLGSIGQPTIQQTLVVDAARPAAGTSAEGKEDNKIRRRETIFGPDVGDDDQPGWTEPTEGNKVSVDVVKAWVERAKNEEGLHATTTLQALVNLKRPTLLLQPLETSTSTLQERDGMIVDPVTPSPDPAPLHLLKFNYDATTPLVSVTLSIHRAATPVTLTSETTSENLASESVRTVYTGKHNGGFNQEFSLPVEYALDLSSAVAPSTRQGVSTEDDNVTSNGNNSNTDLDVPVAGVPRQSQSDDTNRSSIERDQPIPSNLPNPTNPTEQSTVASTPEAAVEHPRSTRRFGIFSRRQRETDVEAGQIEMTTSVGADAVAEIETKQEEAQSKEPEKGMRLLIRIEAIGPEGQILRRRNAQLTHILINGMWVPEAGSSDHPGAGKRVWVVKVVRREAIIGAHTFLLKEIYGLSAANASQPTPPVYPPTSGSEPVDPYASTPNECIVCLTSPRDVVLLPCRHLVVCRECAVGMVEFGAGGRVARREDIVAATGEGLPGGINVATTMPPTAPVPPTTAATRRKKKPKGWYCPVCRQPYTSLLRLALPAFKAEAEHTDQPIASRAPSIHSIRTARSFAALSIAPSLPDGAEAMLGRLAPEDGEDMDEEEDSRAPVYDSERPQFVVEAAEDDSATEHGEITHSSIQEGRTV